MMKKLTGITFILSIMILSGCDADTCNQLVGEGTCNAVLLEVFSSASQVL